MNTNIKDAGDKHPTDILYMEKIFFLVASRGNQIKWKI